MTTKFNRILFDYDGTLIIHGELDKGLQISEMLKIPEEQVPEFDKRLAKLFETSYGSENYANKKITYDLYSYCIEQVMGPLQQFGTTVKQLDTAIRQKAMLDSCLAPCAKELLEQLASEGYELCVFTNGFYDGQVENMKYHGIYDYFEKIYAWDDFYAKPDKRAFKRALAGTDPSSNVMIGDNVEVDIIPAKTLGMYTIAVNAEETKGSVKPDVLLRDLSVLKLLL